MTWHSTEHEACYGRSWEEDDPTCDECDDRPACRRITKRKSRLRPAKRDRSISAIEEDALEDANLADEIADRMPREEEHWGERVLKNVVAGMLSAFGREIMLFFKKWRW